MEKITTGFLTEEIPYYMRELTARDQNAVVRLQEEAGRAMEDPAMLAGLTEEEFTMILATSGSLLIGTFVHEQLIGFRALLVDDLANPEHLGYDIGLTRDQLHEVIYQEITCVSPQYRGHRLQQKMAQAIMEYADLTNFTYVCATVAPFNIPSLKDKLVQGMEIVALGYKYDHALRYTFVREIIPVKRKYSEQQHVAMDHIEYQQKLCEAGWRGTRIMKEHEQWVVQFEK